jgi:hypothetical protein
LKFPVFFKKLEHICLIWYRYIFKLDALWGKPARFSAGFPIALGAGLKGNMSLYQPNIHTNIYYQVLDICFQLGVFMPL